MKQRQLICGTESGYNKLVEMSEHILSPPLIFLTLTVPKKGTQFLRFIIPFLKHNNNLVQNDEGWSKTEDKGNLYELLRRSNVKLCHFFQLIGLNRPVVREELQRLSNDKSNDMNWNIL